MIMQRRDKKEELFLQGKAPVIVAGSREKAEELHMICKLA
jgi:hypothetical protein